TGKLPSLLPSSTSTISHSSRSGSSAWRTRSCSGPRLSRSSLIGTTTDRSIFGLRLVHASLERPHLVHHPAHQADGQEHRKPQQRQGHRGRLGNPQRGQEKH